MEAFSIWHWLVLALIVFVIVKAVRAGKRTDSPASSPEPEHIAVIRGPGTYSFEVVGESNYQSAFDRIFGEKEEDGIDEEVMAELIPDDDNKYDKNAIRVAINGMTVGYLPRKLAKQFRAELGKSGLGKQHRSLHARAKVKGGWDRGDGDTGMYGVWLDLPEASR